MSMLGLLFALAPAVAARVKKPKPVEQFALNYWRKAYEALEAENARLYTDLARLMDENARLRTENGVMREREQVRQDFFQNAQNQQLAANQAQYRQSRQDLLQLTQYQHNVAHFCNCVPDRASFLLE